MTTDNTYASAKLPECKNPYEICVFHTKQIFFVHNKLAEAKGDDDNPILENHHRRFSRFSLGIMNAAGVPATANLNACDVPGILERAKIARDIDMKRRMMASIEDKDTEKEVSKAYTVQIASGTLKGKTPAQVLLENGDEGRKMLSAQGNFLYKNIKKYPANVKQVEAIAEAIGLYDRHELSAENANKTKAIIVPLTFQNAEDGNTAGSIKALKRRTRANGKAFVYQLTLEWHMGAKQPFVVKIMNCYAPLAVLENGLLAPQLSKKESEVVNTFSLTFDQFDWMAHQMESSLRIFEDGVGHKNRAIADEQNRRNLAAANVKGR